ncbi:MAG: hypothetical protein EZS28_056402 [Streblomastix strix]|uniref:Uncharacterized protein n=1 Tax=Streblomastix strix TaxID=222440 RepID=A0A5J4PL65_9EUKA|nr:MAG: hypothetical protein EZS28_056402 [Streblomastix strix]
MNICKGSYANKSESSADINYRNTGDAPPAIARSLIEFSIDGFKNCVNTEERESANVKKRVQPAVDAHAYRVNISGINYLIQKTG